MSMRAKPDLFTDYWCDGHFITARSKSEAREVCIALYGHSPDVVRRWADDDQRELDEMTED